MVKGTGKIVQFKRGSRLNGGVRSTSSVGEAPEISVLWVFVFSVGFFVGCSGWASIMHFLFGLSLKFFLTRSLP